MSFDHPRRSSAFLEELPGRQEIGREYKSVEELLGEAEALRSEVAENLPRAVEEDTGLGLEIAEAHERAKRVYDQVRRGFKESSGFNPRFAGLELLEDEKEREPKAPVDLVATARQLQKINERLDALELEIEHFIDKARGEDAPLAQAMQETDEEREQKVKTAKEAKKPVVTPVLTESQRRLAEENRRRNEDEGRATEVEERLRPILGAFNSQTNEWRRELTPEEIHLVYSDAAGSELRNLRTHRDPKVDAPIVLDCRPDQIAWGEDEWKRKKKEGKEIKVYVGPLFKNCFQTLKDAEHIYTAFPDGEIVRRTIEVGGRTKEELQAELQRQGFRVSNYASAMIDHRNFTTTERAEPMDLVRLRVRDFSLSAPTTENIYKAAEKLGLGLCPAEVGPNYRLQYSDQPLNEWVWVGMEQIPGPGGNPSVFDLRHGTGGLWLHDYWANPEDSWDPDRQIVFRLRK